MCSKSGVSVIVPSIGSTTSRPLPSTGSLDSVPPLRRYYETIRPPIRVPPCSPSPDPSAPFGFPRTAVPLPRVLALRVLGDAELPCASRAARAGRALTGGPPVPRGRMGSPRFLGSPRMRAGFTDPGGLDVPRLVRVRFTRRHGLPHSRTASATNDWAFEAQSHGPHAHCLRFAAALTDGLAQDSFPVGRIPYPGGFRPAGLQVRFHDFLTHRSSSPRLGLAHSRYPTG